MIIREMHYDFKQKLNKIDSQQYRGLKIPEIDWKLNEAIELFVKIVAEPKTRNSFGFETSQRVIDDIRTLVVNDAPLTTAAIAGTDDFVSTLPTDYQHFIGVQTLDMLSGSCAVVADKVYVRQHDDDFQASPFDRSSFLWREANIRFYDMGIRTFTSGEFTVSGLSIEYIKKHPIVHNAADYTGGTYTLLDGTVLAGTQDCELPSHTHREIVDLAVLITTGDLQIPDYQVKQNKLSLNQIKN
jgi:hypothetical protein